MLEEGCALARPDVPLPRLEVRRLRCNRLGIRDCHLRLREDYTKHMFVLSRGAANYFCEANHGRKGSLGSL